MSTLKTIAHIQSDFPTKFGIPRQSCLVEELRATVIFEPEYRSSAALRGLEAFSHIWLIWGFSASEREGWSPTVRPPRLGGNARVGVFATRSPFRPNPLGLSCVKLTDIEQHPALGPIIHVQGADLMDGTPLYDIKPYLPYADSFPAATGGFANAPPAEALHVLDVEGKLAALPEGKKQALQKVLALDPRPPYQNDPARVYGMEFAGFEVKFRVEGEALSVLELLKL